jgi:Fic family protein
MNKPGRGGGYIRQPGGFRAFIPAPLPPEPGIQYDSDLQTLLSDADRELARLDAATEFLPNPDLFVRMYVRKEAVLSSQIEGTQASMVDLLRHEARGAKEKRRGVPEISNYIRAMSLGLEELSRLPLSLRLLKKIHTELMKDVRGGEREPGEFRRSQNWIGPQGCTPADATFVPPPPQNVMSAMGSLETFLHSREPMPVLVKTALAHAQLETIHPFLDGNGRMGRLLITFYLCVKKALRKPTLYLSHYFKQRRGEYYDRLQVVRDKGDFEGWVRFFLEGVRDVSREGTETARSVLDLREQHRALLAGREGISHSAQTLLDSLFEQPVVTVNGAAEAIGKTYPAANKLVGEFESLGILRQISPGARNRVFKYEPYVEIFGELRP